MKIYSSRKGRRIVANLEDSAENSPIFDYLPATGEGSTLASQIATAVNKLVYRWFNDGDVYDNTCWYWTDGLNNISSCANWLYKYVPETRSILDRVFKIHNDKQYEAILDALVNAVSDGEDIDNWYAQKKKGSIYNCDGPFEVDEPLDEDEEFY